MRDLIKRILKEEVGVPRGIADSAKRLYLDLITRLKRKTVTGNSNFNLLFKNKDGKYSFADFKNFENIKIDFEFSGYDENEKKLDVSGDKSRSEKSGTVALKK